MYHLEETCCFCLKAQDSSLANIHSKNETESTDFEKISQFLPNISAVIEQDGNNMICKTCSGTIDMICTFVENCLKNIKILYSYKSVLKETKRKKPRNVKSKLNQTENLKMSDTNEIRTEMYLISDTFQNSDNEDENNFLSENNIKAEVINESYPDVLPTDNDEIKIDIEEVDVKKECLGNIHEAISVVRNQSLDAAVEFAFVDIENIAKQGKVSEENLSTVADNVSTKPDLILVEKQPIVESANKYNCDLCRKTFTEESHLKSHECKPYSCDVCEKSFGQKSTLTRHKMVHTGKRPYLCDVCNKSFAQKSEVTKHKLLHTGEKPFSCDVCNKSFRDRSNFTKHQLLHTGEKPYSCDVCNKSFRFSSNLVSHKRLHTGEKPYFCDKCKKTFRNKSNLHSHEMLHTGERPYLCELCNRSFTSKSHFLYHQLLHTGEKPYSCDVCKKSFTNKSNLVRHERVHIEGKPNSCNVCKKSFRNNINLVVHKCVPIGETDSNQLIVHY